MGRIHLGQGVQPFLNSRGNKSVSQQSERRIGYVNQKFRSQLQDSLPEGSTKYRNVYDATMLSDGSIVWVEGTANTSIASPKYELTQFSAPNVTTVTSDSLDRIIVGNSSSPFLYRYSSSGVEDVSFNNNVAAGYLNGRVNMSISTVVSDSSDGVFLGFYNSSGDAVTFVRVHANGIVDSTFNDRLGYSIGSAENICSAIHVSSNDGSIFVAGNIISVDSQPVNGIAKFHQNGAWDSSFTPNTDAFLYTNITEDPATGKVYICGDFTTVNGVSRKAIARLHANGSTDASFNLADLDPTATSFIFGVRPVPGTSNVLVAGAIRDFDRNFVPVRRLTQDGVPVDKFDLGVNSTVVDDTLNNFCIVYDALPLQNGRYAVYGMKIMDVDGTPATLGITEIWNKNL